MHPIILYTLTMQRERELRYESEERRMLAEASALQPAGPSVARRSAARAFAAVSRGSAAAVRRLDACVADDLGRALAPAE